MSNDKPDTKHLDAAIAIFRGTPGAKRASRKAAVTLNGYADFGEVGRYVIQANGRTVEEGLGDKHFMRQRLDERARLLEQKGMTVAINEY